MINMNRILSSLTVLLLLSITTPILFDDAFAHKDQIIGDYKVSVGWDHEPPVEGIRNYVEIIVAIASDYDKQTMINMDGMDHDSMNGNMTETMITKPITGFNFEGQIKVNGEKTVLDISEQFEEGVYRAAYTPTSSGLPSVDVDGQLGKKSFAATFHPEKIMKQSFLPPLKQVNAGIAPQDIMCKDNMTLVFSISDRPACMTNDTRDQVMEYGWMGISVTT